jgi:hypothetical protein
VARFHGQQFGLILIAAGFLGCDPQPEPPATVGVTGSYFEDYRSIRFQDNVETNAPTDGGVEELTFTDINGNAASLKDYLGKKNVVLVVTRGFNGSICLYCATQTSRLLTSYSKFAERDAEVVVVFPVMTPDDSSRHRDFAVSVKNKLEAPVE